MPGFGLDEGIGFGIYCKLALLPCPPLPPRFAASPGPAVGVRPSLGASLPYDIILRDLVCPFTALFGVLTGMGALCSPPTCRLAVPLTTLSDNAGLCPLLCGAPETEAVRLGGPCAFACTMDDLLLWPPACGAIDCLLSPLGPDVCDAPRSLARSGGSAMFLKVMMHSISSPAYTFGSLQRTKARIFEGGAAGGILEVSVLASRRNASSNDHRESRGQKIPPSSFVGV